MGLQDYDIRVVTNTKVVEIIEIVWTIHVVELVKLMKDVKRITFVQDTRIKLIFRPQMIIKII